MPSTSADAPAAVGSTLTFNNAMSSMTDWLFSGWLAKLPDLKIAYSEGQIGWIPYILERADKVWEDNRAWGGVGRQGARAAVTYYYRQMYGCFFDDEYGLDNLTKIGVDNISFETDYPHSDTHLAARAETAHKLMGHLPPTTWCASSCAAARSRCSTSTSRRRHSHRRSTPFRDATPVCTADLASQNERRTAPCLTPRTA